MSWDTYLIAATWFRPRVPRNFKKLYAGRLAVRLVNSHQSIDAGNDLFGIDILFLNQLDIEA